MLGKSTVYSKEIFELYFLTIICANFTINLFCTEKFIGISILYITYWFNVSFEGFKNSINLQKNQ